MSLNQPDIRELRALVDWAHTTTDVRELSIKYGDIELFVSRNERTAMAPTTAAPVAMTAPAPEAAPAATATAVAPAPAPVAAPASTPTAATEDEVVITAPMVGIFYASPKPGSPAFVNVGDRVSPDSVLCILEVMKLMNNIEANVDGVVTQILVENEQAVEYGQPLMVIKRDA
ncbi:acetyl-CoA carboxylase biotin carboxyl carrier protein [Arthrobacter sulfonylureivorans]|uniref:Biotin carboxyl carrier protein of acetyl-CoA carboxylase n=1 Tax=Arthrobacter sulfonylureivorans TaxID=2486855 RepID=A0ABY3WBP6_9MICC|nr:acetyl-CoA carboxylase biotin carboxyl carrier protein [Arthrobacter sulfonylureivorans]UNK47789.1 acetyl-CoA carboxylase biotin carboxyl carrier protein [Arthrobacter sulfonylureivorans]